MTGAEVRERLIALLKTGSDEDLDQMNAAIELGTLLLGMLESLNEAEGMSEDIGVDLTEGSFCTSTIIGHAPTGKLYSLMVKPADESDRTAHMKALAEATEMQTKH